MLVLAGAWGRELPVGQGGPALSAMLDAVHRRPELRVLRRPPAYFVPQVRAHFVYRTGAGPHWDADTWTRTNDDGDWLAWVELAWAGRRSPRARAAVRPVHRLHQDAIDRVFALHRARQALEPVAGERLLPRTLRQLHVAEIEAQLHAITKGGR